MLFFLVIAYIGNYNTNESIEINYDCINHILNCSTVGNRTKKSTLLSCSDKDLNEPQNRQR